MTSSRFRVGMSTFGFMYRAPLGESLAMIAAAGYRDVEIAPNPPHFLPTEVSAADVRALARTLTSLDLRCVSINPPEMNLISPNPRIRDLCRDNYVAAMRVLAELGGSVVMVVPGRYNGLIPMPEPDALAIFYEQIEALLTVARELGLTLALETTPFGFLGSTRDLVDAVDTIGDPRVGIAVDVANIYPREDISDAIRRAGHQRLKMAQFSDTWRDRWAHTSIGRGELDFDALRAALAEISYQGPAIYELVDGEDPVPRIAADLRTLEAAGWSR